MVQKNLSIDYGTEVLSPGVFYSFPSLQWCLLALRNFPEVTFYPGYQRACNINFLSQKYIPWKAKCKIQIML